jgi:hypothetical protein
LSDQNRPTEQFPLPPRRLGGRGLLLIGGAVVVVIALVLTLVIVRSGSGGNGGNGNGGGGGTGPGSPTSSPPKPSAGEDTSAAKLLGWGQPMRTEEFDGPLGKEWLIYNGAGHDGDGKRSPEALSFSDGLMTMSGDSDGKTGGMAWQPGQKYGRWEVRMKAPASDPTYHAVLLLWPDKEDWPVGGEVDFAEMTDESRQHTKYFLHYGKDNRQEQGEVAVDATQWHNWAVEWTPDHIIAYLDGKEWYRSDNQKNLPPRAMHLTIQLDWFPDDGDDDITPSQLQVDWAKEYKIS